MSKETTTCRRESWQVHSTEGEMQVHSTCYVATEAIVFIGGMQWRYIHHHSLRKNLFTTIRRALTDRFRVCLFYFFLSLIICQFLLSQTGRLVDKGEICAPKLRSISMPGSITTGHAHSKASQQKTLPKTRSFTNLLDQSTEMPTIPLFVDITVNEMRRISQE